MEDRELLELAAKAAGLYVCQDLNSIGLNEWGSGLWVKEEKYDNYRSWNPREDNGDALFLAVVSGIKFRWHKVLNQALAWPGRLTEDAEIHESGEDHGGDRFSATRRAIVRAAAEIGKAMP